MEKDILDIITEYAVNEGMDKILLKDAEYVKIQDRISNMASRFDKLNLAKEERLIVERMIAVHVAIGAFYGKITWQSVTSIGTV